MLGHTAPRPSGPPHISISPTYLLPPVPAQSQPTGRFLRESLTFQTHDCLSCSTHHAGLYLPIRPSTLPPGPRVSQPCVLVVT